MQTKQLGKSGRKGMRQEKRLTGRKCYDHLGGRLGAMLFSLYIQNGWISLEEGKSTVYAATPKGEEAFRQMGLTEISAIPEHGK